MQAYAVVCCGQCCLMPCPASGDSSLSRWSPLTTASNDDVDRQCLWCSTHLAGMRLIVGDLHGASAGADAVCSIGQAEQLLERDPLAVVTFLGDLFDRGTEPVVTLVKVLLLKLRFPHNVVLLRGNHEVGCLGSGTIQTQY